MDIEEYKTKEKNWSFPPEFRVGASPTIMVSGVENIRQSLQILFSTITEERVYRPDYGFAFSELSFEPADLSTRVLVENNIRKVVDLYEPRVSVESVIIDDSNSLNGVWQIQIVYTIIRDNTTDSLNFSWMM